MTPLQQKGKRAVVLDDRKEVIKDLEFCEELMKRLVALAKKAPDNSWYDHHTVIQDDIRRLRRELNQVRQKLDWTY